jgi:retinol-binding protein 3
MGDMVAFISSYLFAERTHLSDNFRRADNVTTEQWTLPYVPGKKFTDKPVFVLISKRTFSAGEGLAYVLKDLNRATLIGETTEGGSGTIDFKPIDDHFTLVVPTGRVISPVTKTDWARTGVEPDVKVAANDALDEALKRGRGGQ